MEAAQIEFYLQLAKSLARQFGPNCEVVVHDLKSGDVEHSIVAIENGHVTGRKVGDGPSHVVLEALKGAPQKLRDHLGYLTRTEDGRILKSSTIYIRNEAERPVGIFSINYDITRMLSMGQELSRFTATEDLAQPVPEAIAKNVSDLLTELIRRSVALVGKPAALMNKEERVRAVHFLDQSGAFLITRSGDRVCKLFGISKYTLYNYLEEGKALDGNAACAR